MLMNYAECEHRFQGSYKIKAALRRQELFRIERGIYATQKCVPEIAIITKKYPHAILTMESAFYLGDEGLSDPFPATLAFQGTLYCSYCTAHTILPIHSAHRTPPAPIPYSAVM